MALHRVVMGFGVGTTKEHLPPAGVAAAHGFVSSRYEIFPPHWTELLESHATVADRDHLYVPPTTSRILLSAVPIDPEILEPIWRQLGVADRVLIDAEANPGGVSYCPSGSRSASKIPLA